MSPLIGLAFDRLLFRHIPNSNSTAKLVCGICLLVGIPSSCRSSSGPEPRCHGDHLPVLQPERRLLHALRHADQRDLPVHHLGHGGGAGRPDVLLRYTSLGLQMRGAVESRRLVQLDGVNAEGVVAGPGSSPASWPAWPACCWPDLRVVPVDNYATLMVAAIAAAAWGLLRSIPIATGVAVLIGVVSTVLQGYLPTAEPALLGRAPGTPVLRAGRRPALPARHALARPEPGPLATIDPPPPPTAASSRVPSMDRIIRSLWWVLLAAFFVSMLTWMPKTWEGVFNSGLALSTVLLSITLITGMAGQLSLCQATLAGVGAFTSAQLANHLGLNMLVGGLSAPSGRGSGGRAGAALVAVARARPGAHDAGRRAAVRQHLLQCRLHHRGSGRPGASNRSGWAQAPSSTSTATLSSSLCFTVLAVCVVVVLLVRKGPWDATWPPCGEARWRRPVSGST
jgi:branched-chain amino acid transport system permease protein